MAERKTFQRLASGLLNRKQRRELERKLSAEDPGLEIVNRHVAGIDVVTPCGNRIDDSVSRPQSRATT
jgi:hypothetical protein